MSSRNRLAWRALRAISEIPLLWLSSSSRVMIGRNTSCSSNRNRLVGSCIRTLVSRTNSLVPEGWDLTRREGTESICSVGFNKVEHLLCVARNLDPAPLAPDDAVAIEDEGAALDAAYLLAVHVLHLHDAELIADFLILIRKELEGKAHLGLEALVRLDAVARDTVHGLAGLHELGMQIAKLGTLDRATGSAVLRIEVQDHTPGLDRREPELASARGGQREVPYRFFGHPVCTS